MINKWIKIYKNWRKLFRKVSALILATLLFFLSALTPPILSVAVQSSQIQTQQDLSLLIQQGQRLYQKRKFEQAATIWQQIAEAFAAKGDRLNQAMALSNLSLTYQELGQWNAAEKAINDSLNHLQQEEKTLEQQRMLAQSLDILGQLQRATGKSELALATWQKSAKIYAEIGNNKSYLKTQINQAEALQDLGLYQKACNQLVLGLEIGLKACKNLTDLSPEILIQKLEIIPDSFLKFDALHSLGNTLQLLGNLELSQTILNSSLAVAKALQSPEAQSVALLSLGNITRTLLDRQELTSQNSQEESSAQEALNFYQEAAKLATSPLVQLQAEVNQFTLLLERPKNLKVTSKDYQDLWSSIQTKLNQLPPSKTQIYTLINLAVKLLELNSNNHEIFRTTLWEPPSKNEIETLLKTTLDQAKILGDKKAESYASGNLGKLSEQNQQWEQARKLTEAALLISRAINAPEISYQWQWQLGRILKNIPNREGAVAAYSLAVQTLQSLRKDLAAISSDAQFSFRKSVEPVYREFVELLLQPGANLDESTLIQARQVIESLQVAELDNFFRDACANVKPVQIDQIDPKATVFYPIILRDRLEVIVTLPGKKLKHYQAQVGAAEVEETLKQMREALTSPQLRSYINTFLEPSQKVYNWLIRPIEADLVASDTQTLVFVLDGALRNIPMASLHNGQQYLAQQYNIAIAPGLQLIDAHPFTQQKVKVIAGGLSEARQGFPPLPGVKKELQQIKAEVASTQLLNQSFTETRLKTAINSFPFPIVHLATHGQFSSQADNTFILTWDRRIRARDLDNLLRGNRRSARPIELLVLSACSTAVGDQRAALGLAGVAVRAGARSTIASLWRIDDQTTALFMAKFYEELAKNQVTKAEALRLTQEAILGDARSSHPYFWAAFVLVGNWL